MPSRTLPVVNKLGMHARAASKFVTVANRFGATVRVRRESKEADGKSIFGVLSLGAARGTAIEVEAEGDDADAALDALEALLADRFGEDE
ncbi:MAG: HPr family phosphocarrier protein [Ectothiorhodospiraceae bacterium]|nr:HPr family phosphocarrier protein [Chromatiales bacterium]MCP5157306.1 HPr family phosphocarrier protein [Ectothiorhodospiraceae bacterium]